MLNIQIENMSEVFHVTKLLFEKINAFAVTY